FQAEDGIRDLHVTGVQTCALPILPIIEIASSPFIASTFTLPELTSTTLPISESILNDVPTTCVVKSSAITRKGFSSFFATSKKASPFNFTILNFSRVCLGYDRDVFPLDIVLLPLMQCIFLRSPGGVEMVSHTIVDASVSLVLKKKTKVMSAHAATNEVAQYTIRFEFFLLVIGSFGMSFSNLSLTISSRP